ncbi:MAG: alanine--tRNA ligase [Candidatus Hadarchaeota archaeon]
MKDIYQVELFKREGFEQKKCKSCGRVFWTLDPARELCGDTPCVEYTFIGNPPTRKKLSLAETEAAFLKFFKRQGHETIKRYPVAARWRDDIFLTIASIADFQPWVTSGQAPPPANPLVVSQPSIRLNDVDNVGRSGRHFTLFFMGGHHAFNSSRKKVYWNDRTVELCHKFLTRQIGIRPREITYVQDMWEGGGNAGEDFEVNVRGLEVATLVFMHYAGEKGKYEPLPLEIVDTGYGMERLTWLSQGTPTSYEPIFGPVIDRLRNLSGIQMPPDDILRENSKLAGIIDIAGGRDIRALRSKVAERTGTSVEELERLLSPVEAIYAVADHLRCLAFMLADGITPSNVKEGYLARLVLRRALRFMRELKIQVPISEIMKLNLDILHKQFPELQEKSDYVLQVLELEERRYREAIDRGKRLVERMAGELLSRREPMSESRLLQLWESHGLPPELAKEAAEKSGVKVAVPDDFYIKVAQSHSRPRHVPSVTSPVPTTDLEGLPRTKLIYYSDPYQQESEAKVVRMVGEYLVLDRTIFYPEGGGQPSDVGEILAKGAKTMVKDVVKVGDIVLHRVGRARFNPGQKVRMKLDWERRSSLMAHHTGTHVLLGAMRRVLGNHVWQQGVQKGVDRSRIDISHFRRISPEELVRIERLANEVVVENRPVNAVWMDRNEAEGEHGFDLYQGGVVPGKLVRVVDIEGWNTQACAGTHYTRTGEVGFIKVVRTERIQDGIERLEFAVGKAALKFAQAQERQLVAASGILRTTPEKVVSAVQQLFDERRAAQKEVERLGRRLAELRLAELRSKARAVGNFKVIAEEVEGASAEELIETGNSLVRGDRRLVVILGSHNGVARVVVMAGDEAVAAGADCGAMAAEASRVLGGGGGGKPRMGQGGGPKKDFIIAALKKAIELCEKQQKQSQ